MTVVECVQNVAAHLKDSPAKLANFSIMLDLTALADLLYPTSPLLIITFFAQKKIVITLPRGQEELKCLTKVKYNWRNDHKLEERLLLQ